MINKIYYNDNGESLEKIIEPFLVNLLDTTYPINLEKYMWN